MMQATAKRLAIASKDASGGTLFDLPFDIAETMVDYVYPIELFSSLLLVNRSHARFFEIEVNTKCGRLLCSLLCFLSGRLEAAAEPRHAQPRVLRQRPRDRLPRSLRALAELPRLGPAVLQGTTSRACRAVTMMHQLTAFLVAGSVQKPGRVLVPLRPLAQRLAAHRAAAVRGL